MQQFIRKVCMQLRYSRVSGGWLVRLVSCVLWGEVRAERAAIDVRGRERSRVLCFYGVSDVAACWNPRGMVLVR